MVKIKPHHVHLICNAKYHDTDFARTELVKLFSEHDDLGVSISQDYSDFYKFKDFPFYNEKLIKYDYSDFKVKKFLHIEIIE